MMIILAPIRTTLVSEVLRGRDALSPLPTYFFCTCHAVTKFQNFLEFPTALFQLHICEVLRRKLFSMGNNAEKEDVEGNEEGDEQCEDFEEMPTFYHYFNVISSSFIH